MLRTLLACLLKRKAIPGGGQATRVGLRTEITGAVEMRAPKSKVFIGMDCLIEGTLVAETDDSEIEIGDNVFVGGGTVLDCARAITIEDDVLISYQCIISDSDNHSLKFSIRKKDLAESYCCAGVYRRSAQQSEENFPSHIG